MHYHASRWVHYQSVHFDPLVWWAVSTDPSGGIKKARPGGPGQMPTVWKQEFQIGIIGQNGVTACKFNAHERTMNLTVSIRRHFLTRSRTVPGSNRPELTMNHPSDQGAHQ